MKLQDLQSLQDIEYDIYVPKIHNITMIIVSVAFSFDQTVSTGCTVLVLRMAHRKWK